MARRSVLVAVAIVVLLASCDDIVGPPRRDPDLAGTTVEVAATWSGTERENFQAVLDAFAARTGATVRYTAGGNDLPVLLNSRIASG
ncbi:hypothetical protein ACH495_10320 [Micromonospora sp. NPDC018662]|uniref:hypothetical protein n=1 Tax=Micromonospora sp. NPDC018662 TaxID=3364238 RepID=UPI0037B3883D